MILLSVVTAPRPRGVDYLSNTIAALDAAGANLCDEKWIVSDGISLDAAGGWYAGWQRHFNAQRTGARLAMWRVFMLAKERDADWLIYCEDDLNTAPRAIDTIIDNTHESWHLRNEAVAFLSYYDGRIIEEGAPSGVYPTPCMTSETEYFCGALCMLIPRRTIDYLCSVDPLDCPPFQGSFHSGDCVMGYHLSRSPWPNYGIVIPTLVDHRGDVSAVGEGRKALIRGRNFAGVRDAVYTELQRPFYAPKK